VVIPARNEELRIGELVNLVSAQRPDGWEIEVLVVDDGSTDRTAEIAAAAGARVLRLGTATGEGSPAIARNRGARSSRGDPIVFVDADCLPRPGWLAALLHAHRTGAEVAGGALALPPGLSATARCDYFGGWYHVHPARPAGRVAQHPPGNLSVRRSAFFATAGFSERQPIAYAHEELAWQGAVQAQGGRIVFVPEAVVDHYNRAGFAHLLRRNYRWGYSAIAAKAAAGNARFPFLYRHPVALVAVSLPLSLLSTVYILCCWLAAGIVEPLWMAPALLMARAAYGAGMLVGGIRWLRGPEGRLQEYRPRWE
jgi:glycosyltransferase involved in cell wall biosynthesis